MKRRRVKITGIGPVTPAGIGKEAFWKGILEPVSRVRPCAAIDASYGPISAAFIDDFSIDAFLSKSKVPKGAARHSEFAIAAAVLALRDAGVTVAEARDLSTVVVTGSTLFDFEGIGNSIVGVERRGARAASPRLAYTSNTSAVATSIIEALELTADASTLQTSCASGVDAIGTAFSLISSGRADIAICGGSDAPLFRFPILEFRAAGLTPASTEMAERLSRPFDMWRTTGVVSEGACMLILEVETSTRPAYAMLEAYDFANDLGSDLCGGMVTAGRRCLAMAKLRPADVDCINAWGPGHRAIDIAESRAMANLFGTRIGDIPSVSIKGAIGAPLSAAGAMQAASAALSLRHKVVPPTVNFEYPDPECVLNLSAKPRYIEHAVTLVNAHGTGGLNSALVLQRC